MEQEKVKERLEKLENRLSEAINNTNYCCKRIRLIEGILRAHGDSLLRMSVLTDKFKVQIAVLCAAVPAAFLVGYFYSVWCMQN